MSARPSPNADKRASATPPIPRTRCSSPRTPAPAKPKCWSTASRACCSKARSRRRSSASPTPRPPPPRCSAACSNASAAGASPTMQARRRAGKTRRRQRRSRPRPRVVRASARNAGRPARSKPSTPSANACSRASRSKPACRRASTSPTKPAPPRCSAKPAPMPRSRQTRPRDAFRRFAERLYGDHLDGLLDRLALRRADFRRFAQKHQGDLFAEPELRDRHGVTPNARRNSARDFLARQRLARAARSRGGAANWQRQGSGNRRTPRAPCSIASSAARSRATCWRLLRVRADRQGRAPQQASSPRRLARRRTLGSNALLATLRRRLPPKPATRSTPSNAPKTPSPRSRSR